MADAAQRILLVQSSASGVYQQFANVLEEQIYRKTHDVSIDIVDYKDLNEREFGKNQKNVDIYIAIGINAAEAVVKINNNTPKIFSLIPDSLYEERLIKITKACPQKTCLVLTLDQPFKRQLKILRLALPHAKNILIPKSSDTLQDNSSHAAIAKSLGISIHYLMIHSNDTLIDQLKETLPNSDVVLALPNNSIYNSITARPILLITYKNSVPIFAYSQSFVDAGAVIGVYSTPAQYAEHAAELVLKELSGSRGEYPQMQPPKYFTIGINRSVAESLNLQLPDIESLYLQLEKSE